MRLTLSEAAQRLGKTDRQVRYMIEQGTLKASKKGGRWLVQSDDLPLSDGQRQAVERQEQQLRDAVDASTYLGFRISKSGLSPGPKIKRRLRRLLLQPELRNPDRLRRTLTSYRGLLRSP